MICFSGGSPYQFINIINLKRNVLNNAPGDLLAHTLGGYNDMSTVTQRIKELGIFENVYEFKVDSSDDSKEVLNEELFGLGGNKTSNYINSTMSLSYTPSGSKLLPAPPSLLYTLQRTR